MQYVIFMETSPEAYESWYHFIRYNGNEEALLHLKRQLDMVEFVIIDDCNSAFDLDLDHKVSEQTALDMIRVELNKYLHRKYDGTLQKIDLKLDRSMSNNKKIRKCNKILGNHQIDNYLDGEDNTGQTINEESSEDESSNSNEDEGESVSESEDEEKKIDLDKIPKKLQEVSRLAKIKARNRRKH